MSNPDCLVVNKKILPEILAPAGSFDSVVAACRCGADAVYLGSKQFSARASAQNFDIEELSKTVDFCHDRDVAVHLAINTAVFDREISDAVCLLENAARIGVDAFIISDLGILSLAKEICPSVSLHASTQMSIASALGAEAARDLGFDRVVLAREMNRSEIAEVTALKDIETEVFVHGALCMSVSGQCYMSAFLGERSGNRGRCAQPCRLDFRFQNNGYALSLKDLSLCSHLKDLSDLGVSSFKIEGRMKRPEYVAAAVSLVKSSLLGENTKEISELARDVFSRSGFTDGYFLNDVSKKMFGFRTGDDADKSKTALPRLHELYRREISRVPIEAKLKIKLNEPTTLCFSDNSGNTACVSGVVPEKAKAVSIKKSDAENKISRLGSTPYFLAKLDSEIDDDLFVSPSVLNDLRRQAVEILSQKRTVKPNREIFSPKQIDVIGKKTQKRELIARFEDLNQLSECFDVCDKIIFPVRKIFELDKEGKLPDLKGKIIAELDRFAFSNDAFTKTAIERLKQIGVNRVCVQNISQLYALKNEGLEITYGPFMNVYNSHALKVLCENSVDYAVASFEISHKSFSHLSHFVKIGALVYGYIPLMMTRACPVKAHIGCGSCEGKGNVLTDRTKRKMRVVCKGTVSEIYNSVPLCADLSQMPFETADFLLCYFTNESPKRAFEVLSGVKNGKTPDCTEGFTRGLYKSGVI